MPALGNVRVLFICKSGKGTGFLRTILSAVGLPAFVRETRTDAALRTLREHGFEIVFCDEDTEPHSPVDFVKALRRDVSSRDPTIPVMLISSGATRTQIEVVRDAGFDDIVCTPVSAETIKSKLEQLLFAPRRFVTAKGFVGPDRRRGGNRSFSGEDKRQAQATVFTQGPRVKLD